jgi:anhydro-N-acetylmuramic acid kinase
MLGVTVVGGFPLRDEAAGGAGRPLTPIPDWFLFRSARQTRLLVHLGANLRVTWLSAGAPPTAAVCFDAGPCCDFLDGLAMDLSAGKLPFDPSGRFAVQGRCDEGLVQDWLSHPFLLLAPPRFVTADEFGPAFRQSSLAAARDRRISGRDLLCSANYFAVRALEEALRRFLPLGRRIDEVFVTGGGSWNGLLWKRLRETLHPLPVERSDKTGIPSEARGAIHAALLAYCTMENLPANVPALTGARRSVVLGQMSPGSAENWDRFICNIYDRFDDEESNQAA